MIKYIVFFIYFITLISSCNTNNDMMQEQINSAKSLGQRHATEISYLYSKDENIMTHLLNVKEIEYKLREAGNDSIANIYIHAFEKYIKENAPTLAEEIF